MAISHTDGETKGEGGEEGGKGQMYIHDRVDNIRSKTAGCWAVTPCVHFKTNCCSSFCLAHELPSLTPVIQKLQAKGDSVIQPLTIAIKNYIQWSLCCFLNFKLFLSTPKHVLYNNLQSFKTCEHFYQLGWFNLGQHLEVRFSIIISDLSKFCFEG